MEEDNRILIILGRLFLATGQPLINVFLKKEMWLKVNEKKVIFNIFNAVKNPILIRVVLASKQLILWSSKGLINKKSHWKLV